MKVTRRTSKFFAVFLIVLLLIPGGTSPKAASHREAPLIAEDPTADNTDTYAFVSPEDPTKLVILANYIPFEAPAGGPNFYNFSDQVTYDIHIVNDFSDGDATEDLTFRFNFQTVISNPFTFLYNFGPLTGLNPNPNQNIYQTYTITGIAGPTNKPKAQVLLTPFPLTVPPNYVGINSVPDPDTTNFFGIGSIPLPPQVGGGTLRVFAGQREEGFYADLGAIFDLLQLRTVTGANGGRGVDALAGLNVHTIALELPITAVTKNHLLPTSPNDPNAIIGVYASASRKVGNQLQQVSRLANPLVNEVIIPASLKDQWNTSNPNNESQFLFFYQFPEVATLLSQLFGVNVPPAPRNDIVQALLTGVPGLNCPNTSPTCSGAPVADLLRLNLAIPPKKPGDPGFSRLGVIDGDISGFPNGRRVYDDVVDIALRVMAGVLVPGFNIAPNNALSDGVDGNDKAFLNGFPFLPTPYNGYIQSAGIRSVSETVPEFRYLVVLNGASEVPPVSTTASGAATFSQKDNTVNFKIVLSNISGVTAAHIHSGAAGVNGPIRVNLYTGPTTGALNGTLVEGTFTPADVNGISYNDLINEMKNGTAYVNIHTTTNPNGELRGQIQLQ
jgi:hypothetical protein